MATDLMGGEVLLFGGSSSSAFVEGEDQTWLWSDGVWRRPDLTVEPPIRTEHAIVWDPLRGRAVLTGGR